MSKKQITGIIVIIGLALFSLQVIAVAGSSEEQAKAAAKEWLALVDAGNYQESWESAAGFFKNAVSQEKWQQQMAALRQPLGKTTSRKLKSAKYTKTLPGAPDGEYVVIQYQTSFAKKKSAVETVTPMLDNDGKWKVSGYYIK
jgi:Protein of unknown function (DUF4019)